MNQRSFSEQDLHLALDGEMPGEDVPAFEAWLETNPDMKALSRRFAQDRQRLREALEPVLAEPVPASLTKMASGDVMVSAGRRMSWPRNAAAAVILLALGGAGGYLAGQRMSSGGDVTQVDDAIAAHLIYANEKRHVVEVAADQADHLNSWLSNRVGVKLAAPDLRAQGFELVGGRLLPAGEQMAAQYMYQDPSGVRVSLYVTRDGAKGDGGFRLIEQRGARALSWWDGGYRCAVTGTLPQTKLTQIADSAYEQLEPSFGVH